MEEKKQEQDEIFDLSNIKQEVQDGPSEEEFTKAMDALSDTDRDIFEDTGIIHVDRDMPAETQAMHIIHLQKKHEKQRKKLMYIIIGFMLVGVVIALIGIFLKQFIDVSKSPTSSQQVQTTQDSQMIAIDEATFPDTIFRSYISKSFDSNQDGMLSSEEIQSVIMIIAPEDPSLTSLQGISYFTELQSLTFSNTGVSEVDLTSNTKLTFVACNNTPIITLTLPNDSSITEIDTTGTSLSCMQNDEHYYQSCTYIAS